ncbi:hypothetical protein PR048_006687 [Dryococelus australis]|uniref:Uncharacterized protein n=1 Tax=Dryococelus australis TaxID=614101 RepID=A0ABQ9IBM3_9NEOP|nr:hypothetical protein PR048_006687 [Dryococelus australis]
MQNSSFVDDMPNVGDEENVIRDIIADDIMANIPDNVTAGCPLWKNSSSMKIFSLPRFAMKAYIVHNDLQEVINTSQALDMDDTWKRKYRAAHLHIILFVEKTNYFHIRDARTMAEAWKALENAFEDSGLTK